MWHFSCTSVDRLSAEWNVEVVCVVTCWWWDDVDQLDEVDVVLLVYSCGLVSCLMKYSKSFSVQPREPEEESSRWTPLVYKRIGVVSSCTNPPVFFLSKSFPLIYIFENKQSFSNTNNSYICILIANYYTEIGSDTIIYPEKIITRTCKYVNTCGYRCR